MLFGWFTLVCLIINETRSIIENLLEIGIKVPGFLIKGLDIYEKIIEKTLDNSIEEKRKDD
ncbi:MAG: phage holin family protein [Clostridia bacterium]|nr:phage holin family protein [Clostridia bacterium]